MRRGLSHHKFTCFVTNQTNVSRSSTMCIHTRESLTMHTIPTPHTRFPSASVRFSLSVDNIGSDDLSYMVACFVHVIFLQVRVRNTSFI